MHNECYSTEHIPNSEVGKIFDGILTKIYKAILAEYQEEINSSLKNSDDLYYWALAMLNKYRIQYYSALTLTYKKSESTFESNKFLDITSIHNIIRSCYETYLIFDYIYIQPENNDEERRLRILLYKYDGYYWVVKNEKKGTENYNNAQKFKNDILKQISKNIIFKNKKIEDRRQILIDCRWKPSYREIAGKTEFSKLNSSWQYSMLSMYAHNSFVALRTVNGYYWSNYTDYNVDCINCHLYEMTTLIIIDLMRLFHKINLKKILTNDEWAIMGEFRYMAQLKDVTNQKNTDNVN
ncbi:hypothetical protein [Clostridium butyricum]|uniref:hypothetical protein n=1 Tax=Clostridium butyricum TaxID=1492 RepID=UPI0034669C85